MRMLKLIFISGLIGIGTLVIFVFSIPHITLFLVNRDLQNNAQNTIPSETCFIHSYTIRHSEDGFIAPAPAKTIALGQAWRPHIFMSDDGIFYSITLNAEGEAIRMDKLSRTDGESAQKNNPSRCKKAEAF